MHRKVFVNGIETKTRRIVTEHVSKNSNTMVEEFATNKNFTNKKRGFKVRKMNISNIYFVTKENDLKSDISNAKHSIDTYLMLNAQPEKWKKKGKSKTFNFYFDNDSYIIYIENEKLMKVNNRNYGVKLLEEALYLLQQKDTSIRYTFEPYLFNESGNKICKLTYIV